MTTGRESSPVVVRLAERGQDPDGSFRVRVSFGDAAEYDARVSDPADQTGEVRLAWYFEEHLRYPFLDKDLEQQAVEQIAAYGQALFGQVFGGAASHDYRRLRERGFDGCRMEVSGSAAFHRLHWEALRDPDLAAPLAVRLPVTRRVERLPSKFDAARRAADAEHPGGDGPAGRPRRCGVPDDFPAAAGRAADRGPAGDGGSGPARDLAGAAGSSAGGDRAARVGLVPGDPFRPARRVQRLRRAGGRPAASERLLFSSGALVPFEGRRGFLFFETAPGGQGGAGRRRRRWRRCWPSTGCRSRC